MIKLNNVSKTYFSQGHKVPALTNINLIVQTGEIFGVIGPSGAGKSTLIRCVNLLEIPSQGSVQVNDQLLTNLSPQDLRKARQSIGMVFQHFNLLETRTVYQNVALPLQLLKKSKDQIRKIVNPLLDLTDLQHRIHAYPNQLSGGQKQRVAIARALATQPSVLLCDEMTSSLDPKSTRSILELIKNINKEMHLSILLITHEINVIKYIANQVAVLNNGQIIEQADTYSLFRSPRTEIAKAFISPVLQCKLPPLIQEKLHSKHMPNDQTLIRIQFSGLLSKEPIISKLISQFNIQINILQASMDCIGHCTIGTMIVTLTGSKKEMQCAIQKIQDTKLNVEVLGYVNLNG